MVVGRSIVEIVGVAATAAVVAVAEAGMEVWAYFEAAPERQEVSVVEAS